MVYFEKVRTGCFLPGGSIVVNLTTHINHTGPLNSAYSYRLLPQGHKPSGSLDPMPKVKRSICVALARAAFPGR